MCSKKEADNVLGVNHLFDTSGFGNDDDDYIFAAAIAATEEAGKTSENCFLQNEVSNRHIVDADMYEFDIGDFSFSEDVHQNFEKLENEYWMSCKSSTPSHSQVCNKEPDAKMCSEDTSIHCSEAEVLEEAKIPSTPSSGIPKKRLWSNGNRNSQNTDTEHFCEQSQKENCKPSSQFKNQSVCDNYHEVLHADLKNDGSSVAKLNPRRTSLLSSIKKKLKQNACHNFMEESSSVSKMKETTILNALEEAQKIQDQLSASDIGPFYGLPSKMPSLLKQHRGIDELYEWQHECLSLPAVKERKNLIYSLPTSGGKTLVAEILIMKEILCRCKNAMLVLPYVSIVQEKVRNLAPFAVDLNFIVEEYAGHRGAIPPRKRLHRHIVYVCTIEKAHSVVNSLIELKRMDEIGILVVDEIHMLGEKGRGSVLESLLAKVLFTAEQTQIVGMSATIGNMEDLREFLHAELYCKDFRPVELREFVKVGNELWEFDKKNADAVDPPMLARTLDFKYTPEMSQKDPDFLVGLVMEVIPQNSCLIFCPTKKHCENVASLLRELLPESLTSHNIEKKEELYKAFESAGNGNVCSILTKTIRYGVAYHHSGLIMEERKLIEEAYSTGTLCCLTCTSTLAAGVNLPAKRVILRAPYVGKEFLTISRYKQMVGRAGRAGIDTAGESILIIKPGGESEVKKLFASRVEECKSDLLSEESGLQMLLLGLIGLEIASSFDEIYDFIDHTLASVQCRQVGETPTTIFQETITQLMNYGLVHRRRNEDGKFMITCLGKAALKGMVNLSSAEELCEELRQGLQALALHSYLHLLYLVTPPNLIGTIRYSPDIYYRRYMALCPKDQKVAERIGITESIIVLLVSGRAVKSDKKPILDRFYLTLILYDLWLQNSVWSVARNYQIHRGVVHNLLTCSAAYGAGISHFCDQLDEFWAYKQLLPNFIKQLSYCATMELIPLMDLPGVKRGRARQLYSSGFKTILDIAKADPRDLVSKVDHMPRCVATQIVSAAKMILLEKAEALQDEAEELVAEFNANVTLS